MKNIITIIALAMLFFSTANAERITILHVNDTHSNLTDGCGRDEELKGNIGGIARAASVIGSEKMAGGNVLALHAGDLFIGDPMFVKYLGVPELQIMGSLGFDAMTLGNHEFDLGVENLIGVMGMAFPEGGFNFISTNLVPQTPVGEALQSMTLPYLVKTYGDIKVGIFGFTTPEANALSQAGPDVVFPETEEELAAKLIETLTALRGIEGCQVVIMLSHLGYSLDKYIGENVPGIDIIIGGHDHYTISQPEQFTNAAGTTYFVQAGAYYHNIGKMVINIDQTGLTLEGYQLIELNRSIPEEPTVKAILDELAAQIDAEFEAAAGVKMFSQAVAVSEEDLSETPDTAKKHLDTDIGNLVTDAFRNMYHTDIAIEPCGSTQQKLYQGPLTPLDLYRCIGYGINTVNGLGFRTVTFDITGANLYIGLETGLGHFDLNDEFLIQVSGMKYGYDLSKPAGERVQWVTINGETVNPASTYSVATNEFVAMILPALNIEITNLQIYDVTEFQALLTYVVTEFPGVPLNSDRISLEERISSKKEDNDGNAERPLEVYPNPAKDKVHIKFDPINAGNYDFKLVDSQGETKLTKNLGWIEKNNSNVQIDLKGLRNGSYYFLITNGLDNFRGSLVISK